MRRKPRFEYSGSQAAVDVKVQPRKDAEIAENETEITSLPSLSVLFVARRFVLSGGRAPHRAIDAGLSAGNRMKASWRQKVQPWTGAAVRWLGMQRTGVGLPLRILGYAGIWWIITGGEGGWLWGLPAVLIAALFNPFPTTERWRWRLRGVLVFVPVFVSLSLRSAADVAWRAVQPSRPLDPAVIDFIWHVEGEQARVFLANLINLMPGTLCVRITDRGMTVHILGDPVRRMAGLERLEAVVGGLFRPVGEKDD